MRNGAFVHRNLLELLEFLEQACRMGSIDPEAIEIHIDFEMRREGGTEFTCVLDEVPPGAAFGFEGRIAVAHRQPAFADPVLGREVDIPPGEMATIAVLLAE